MQDKVENMSVEYNNFDGFHLFTPGDKMTKGLCAGNYDLEKAFASVIHQVKVLMKHNNGIECEPQLAISPAELQELIASNEPKSSEGAHFIPSAKVQMQIAA
ncbi:MAG: hypothetical protein HAW65_01225 [Alphaproteobacteria bacterium]|nr:hypothetical protein [Alphaproteobacteria bacterium]